MSIETNYNKADAVGFGRALGNLVDAIRKDGIGIDDFDELIAAVSTSGSAVNEMKDVPEAAVEHILGAASDTLGDHALAKAIADEQAAAAG